MRELEVLRPAVPTRLDIDCFVSDDEVIAVELFRLMGGAAARLIDQHAVIVDIVLT